LKRSPQGVAVDVQGTEINNMVVVKGGAKMSGLKRVKCFLPLPVMEFLGGKQYLVFLECWRYLRGLEKD
jgi:hypothetical protein